MMMDGTVVPARISQDGRMATWNPAMASGAQVVVRVARAGAGTESRRTMNSGRARVREGERIEAIIDPRNDFGF